MIKFLSNSGENQDDKTLFPHQRRRSSQHKLLLPTLCDSCYRSFENAVGSAIENNINFVAAYCPHTCCLVTIELLDNDHHCVGVYGPMAEEMAKQLVDERFSEMTLDSSTMPMQ